MNRYHLINLSISFIYLNTDFFFFYVQQESSSLVNSVLVTAEGKVKQAAESAQPLAAKLDGPIKKVDSLLCTSLDFVEEKVPCIKLPPGEVALLY